MQCKAKKHEATGKMRNTGFVMAGREAGERLDQ
jgi:hypothetical protein